MTIESALRATRERLFKALGTLDAQTAVTVLACDSGCEKAPVEGTRPSRRALDAWLAAEGLTADPNRAIVIANFVDDEQNLSNLLHTTRGGTLHEADGGVFSPGTDYGDQVLFNVLPGRAQIGGGRTVNGCATNCQVEAQVTLEPGTITYVDGFRCTTVCF